MQNFHLIELSGIYINTYYVICRKTLLGELFIYIYILNSNSKQTKFVNFKLILIKYYTTISTNQKMTSGNYCLERIRCQKISHYLFQNSYICLFLHKIVVSVKIINIIVKPIVFCLRSKSKCRLILMYKLYLYNCHRVEMLKK